MDDWPSLRSRKRTLVSKSRMKTDASGLRLRLKRRNYPWLDKVQHAEHMFINKEALGPIIICLSCQTMSESSGTEF